MITDAALDRLSCCLADYGAAIGQHQPGRVLATGTSAVRDAPNRSAVAAIVSRHLRTDLRVLSGDDEATLAFAGARRAVPQGGGAIVLDIGGGSTEIVWGEDESPNATVSLALGCVRQTERFITTDPATRFGLSALESDARTLLQGGVAALGGLPAIGDLPLVGVAGTVTSLAAMTRGSYDRDAIHGTRLHGGEILALKERLSLMTLDERRRVPGLHPDRAPVIVAGAVIAHASLVALDRASLIVSELDILDGLLAVARSETSNAGNRMRP